MLLEKPSGFHKLYLSLAVSDSYWSSVVDWFQSNVRNSRNVVFCRKKSRFHTSWNKWISATIICFTIYNSVYFQFIRKRHLGGGFIIYDINKMSTSKNQKVSEIFGVRCCHLTKKKIQTQSRFSVKFINVFFELCGVLTTMSLRQTWVSVPLQNHQTDPDLGPELYL